MNFESIKAGFVSYLSEKLGESEENGDYEYLQNSSVSIFMYSSEFKDYLVDEIGADASIFSKSINEIMEMDIVNGKLVDETEENTDSFMTEALNEAFSDESVISALDSDNSGNLDEEEINVFLNGLSQDENGEISFDSLAEAVTGIQEGTYEFPVEGETAAAGVGAEGSLVPETGVDISGDGTTAVTLPEGNVTDGNIPVEAEAGTYAAEGDISSETEDGAEVSEGDTDTETEEAADITEDDVSSEAEEETEVSEDDTTAEAEEVTDVSEYASEIEEDISSEEGNTLEDLLSKVYDNKTVIKALDTDGDGSLSAAEKAEFEEYIKGYDGDDSSLSEDDVKQAVSEIIDGTFSYQTTDIQETETTLTTEDTEASDSSDTTTENATAANSTNGSSGTSSVSSTGGTSSSSSSYVNTASTADTGTSLEELEAQRDTLESDISSLREEKDAIYAGEGVEEEQAAYDEAKAAYDNAVENDGNIPDGLKQQREDNLTAISESETKITELKTNINDTEGQISTKEADIASGESNVNALDSSLQTLKSQKSSIESEGEDGDTDKLAEINAKIAEVEADKEEAEAQLDDDKAALDDLNETLDNYNSQLTEEETHLAELEEERTGIEESITSGVWTDSSGNEVKFECSDEVKETLEAFNNAKTALDEAKAEQEEKIKEIDEAISSKQAELDDVNAQIDELKAQETEKENKVSLGDGQEFLDALEEAGGDAYENFGKLCDELGMSEDDAADFIAELCESEEWGDGCIDPVLLCAQIYQESGYDADIVGDSGAALGLGQFHKCAVDEVNNQYGTNYTYADRSDPEKALEMMVLLLKYDYSKTGSTDGMLAMYNQGHASAINETAGQNYVQHVYSRLDSYS